MVVKSSADIVTHLLRIGSQLTQLKTGAVYEQ